MIFVTIGSMFPFDRLIRLMDDWATAHPDTEVTAQIGDGTYEPRAMKFVRMMQPSDFTARISTATLTVAHAGMGSIITSLELAKPIVIFPRRVAEGEITTDHQLHTAKLMGNKPGLHVALTAEDLPRRIADALQDKGAPSRISSFAPEPFVAKIRAFLTA